jgi:FkbH-like protein
MGHLIDEISPEVLLRKRKGLLRDLLAQDGLREVRVAVIGSSTTQEFTDLLEILLAQEGFRPVLHQGDYNRFYEESVLDPESLVSFKPEVVVILTSGPAIRRWPSLDGGEEGFRGCLQETLERFRQVWDALERSTDAVILQNNFEPPPNRPLGGLEAVSPAGRLHFVRSLNVAFAQEAQGRPRLVIQDQAGIHEALGRDRFLDLRRWFPYKILTTPEASLELARSAAATFRALYGRAKKCLVLDLDNTLWGGVIGDDGPDRIRIGRETPEAEAYTEFQKYCLRLHDRGVLLAVCSKNEESVARQGLEHPDSVLKPAHFSAFRANWSPKHENLLAIAKELNIGVDSLVFVDDNPAEREIVRSQLPAVGVPEVGAAVEDFIPILEAGRYFEAVSLTREDLTRAELYAGNACRREAEAKFKDYGEYLLSLEMRAEIGPWKPVYFERIVQLCNKSNQFNLTTRRLTLGEVQAFAADPSGITLYGKLSDRFGDNGLVSLVSGHLEGGRLEIDLWLMSCRVLKRGMEMAMLDRLAAQCQAAGVRQLVGRYLPTEKNAMVKDFYGSLGFERVECAPGGRSTWILDLEGGYEQKNHWIMESADV